MKAEEKRRSVLVQTDMSAHILKFGYFTLMRPHIATATWNNSTDRMGRINAVTTMTVFGTWMGADVHFIVLFDWRCRSDGYHLSQAAGSQGTREEEQEL